MVKVHIRVYILSILVIFESFLMYILSLTCKNDTPGCVYLDNGHVLTHGYGIDTMD